MGCIIALEECKFGHLGVLISNQAGGQQAKKMQVLQAKTACVGTDSLQEYHPWAPTQAFKSL